jgi:SRSO17 transposase
MSLLDHPEAQALLDDAILSPDTVRSCADRLTDFLQRYLPKFYRVEQRENAATVIRGLLSGLERKTCEPIATEAGLPRKPIQFFVGALTVRVRAKQDGRIGPEERLVVIRRVGESRIDSALSNAGPEVPLTELVCSQRQRHRIEECFAAGNGEAGLDHSEVRSWVGWHHHVTLSLLALWFLCLEQRQLGGENPRLDGLAVVASVQPVAAEPGPDGGGDRRGGDAGVAPERGGANLPLVCGHQELPPASCAA